MFHTEISRIITFLDPFHHFLLCLELDFFNGFRTGDNLAELSLHEGLGAGVVEVCVGAGVGVPPVLVTVLGQNVAVSVHLLLQFIVGHPAGVERQPSQLVPTV